MSAPFTMFLQMPRRLLGPLSVCLLLALVMFAGMPGQATISANALVSHANPMGRESVSDSAELTPLAKYLYDEAGAIMTTCFVLITPDRNAGLWYDVPHVAVELHTLPTMCQGAPTVAPNSIGKSLYRAVGPEELADIGASGGRYRVPVGGTEGKYFFETPEQASNFAKMMGDKPYTTTRVTVSPSELGNGQFIHPVGEGPGYFFSTPHVPSGPVTIYNHSVLP